ncbi:YfcE family phosphodiesterase [Candidatus Heimdallarchaeota archaeon]|nr:MAG: YfcE family phosphodiesterase [Candidatus Heimdallarchaeota archaeon]
MVEKLFIAGDFHIPTRAKRFPEPFKKILSKEKWNYIVITGDLVQKEVLERFEPHLASNGKLIACQGNMDRFELPLFPTFTINSIKFGAYHGMNISPRDDVEQLKEVAAKMDVRVLFVGHSHKQLIYEDEEHIILNPGTATGASGGSSWFIDQGIMTISVDVEYKTLTVKSYLLNSHQKLQSITNQFEL